MLDEADSADARLLDALAGAIIPADQRDGGARAVGAGPKLAARLASGASGALYRAGVDAAVRRAQQEFGKPLDMLSAGELHALVGHLRAEAPAFYKQLRMDVSAIYLSDPEVWSRIGFPGPASTTGGHPDFDRPQGAPTG